jgi:diadenosine tetraphosphate (Ap4A) HIT family hydrolase
MAVYVDELRDYRDWDNLPPRLRKWWCHMTADSEDELRAFARRLGLRAEWIQYPGTHRVHFDVQPRYRAKAIEMGAIVETSRQFVERRRAERAAQQATQENG